MNPKKLPFAVRILLALFLGFIWMMISPYFQFNSEILGIDIDLLKSILVLLIIYNTFFSFSNSSTK